MVADARQYSPACERNRDAILGVLARVIEKGSLVLEIASGTGQHAVHFARHLDPSIEWQPSDADERGLASIEAWREAEPSPNLRPPIHLDVLAHPWPVPRADAVFAANMIHISPYTCCVALFDGAAALLAPGAPLVLYGPFMLGGQHTAESNEAFDRDLRARDPRWGVREYEVVARTAADAGFSSEAIHVMPANNFTIVFKRKAAGI
jgi:hypothetical protein